MAITGRPPKPIEQKRLAGNVGKRALPAPTVILPPAAMFQPEPSRPLAQAGRRLWDSAWISGGAWLAETDIEILLMTCEQVDERVALRLKVLREQDWRDRSALRALEALLHDALGMLGFTPSERSRLGLAEVRTADAIQEYRRKAAALGE